MKSIPTYEAKQRFKDSHLVGYRHHLESLLEYQRREGLDEQETKENLVLVDDLILLMDGE